MKEVTYRHYKNGNNYHIVNMCLIQNNNGDWVDAVLYKELGGNLLFCREEKEFKEKFKLVESIDNMQKYRPLNEICFSKLQGLLEKELRNHF
jgi:hypothetical protein